MLIIDIETDGLPIKKDEIVSWRESSNWPEILQFSYKFNDEEIQNFYIKHEYTADKIFFSKHITPELLIKEGIELNEAFLIIKNVLQKTKIIFAHNILFDVNVLFAFLFKHKKMKKDYLKIKLQCTLDCPFFIKKFYKRLKLSDLYEIATNKKFDEDKAHNSIYDVECLYEILKLFPDFYKITP